MGVLNMTDDELLAFAKDSYEELFLNEDDRDYEVDLHKWAMVMRAHEFLKRNAEECGGFAEDVTLVPRQVHGGSIIYSPLFYFKGDDIAELQKIVGYMSAISIDATVDGSACISFTVSDVFKHR